MREAARERNWLKTVSALKVSLKFFIPSEKYFTKEGTISIHTCDLTNIEKLLIDILFMDKYLPFSLGVNDKIITELTSAKLPSDEGYHIMVKIEDNSLKFLIEKDLVNII